MGTLITDPRDPRLLDAGNYGALAVTAETLRGLMRTAGQYGAMIVNAADFSVDGETTAVTRELMEETARDMLTTGSGERFPMPDGEHELVVLRFVVDRAPLSIVYVENYDASYPALVDGHLIDRDEAITAWLGDTDGSEHPDLFPSGAYGTFTELSPSERYCTCCERDLTGHAFRRRHSPERNKSCN